MKSVIRLSAALVIAILAIVEGEAQTNTIQLRNGANSTTILPSASTTISVQIPALTGGTHYLLTSSTNPGSSGASLDGLSDAKSGGAGFTNSLIVGHSTTGTLGTGTGAGGEVDTDNAQFNVGLGYESLEAISSGDGNTGIGYRALKFIETSDNNTAIGNRAMYKATGSENSFVGAWSGGPTVVGNTSSYNSGLGSYVLASIETGNNNVAVGHNAGGLLTTGSGNILIGYEAGVGLVNESDRLFIDNSGTSYPLIYGDFSSDALTFNGSTTTTGTSAFEDVVSIGGTTTAAGEIRLLEDLDDGSHYTAFKAQAQAANVTYILPAADGTNGYVLTTNGSGTLSWAAASGGATNIDGLSDAKSGGASFTNSLLLGHQSVTPTDAEQNTGVGLGGVLQALTSGDQNTAVGYGAADGVSSGFLLTAIGYNALGAASSAARIVAIGAQAGESTTTGAYSVFIGNQAAQSFTGASNVVAVGYGAMRLATGGDNVAIGTEALNGLTTGTNNVAIGTYAGNTNVTTGSGNVFIGDRVYPSINVSNKLYIHNGPTDSPLIYGDFSGSTLTFNGSTTTTGKTTFSPPGSAKAITATTSTGAGAPDIAAFTNTYDKVAVTATTAAGYVQLPAGTDGQVLYLRLAFTADASNSTVTVVNSNNTNTAMVYDGTGADVIVAHMLYTTGEGWVVFSALEYDN